MIKTEYFRTRSDGVRLYKTYSDENFQIERDGILYEEAIDPEGTNRIYSETSIPIESPPEDLNKEEEINYG